jgi:Glucodextranase, domain B
MFISVSVRVSVSAVRRAATLGGLVVLGGVGMALAAAGDPQRVSLDTLGADASAPATGAAVSAQGRWIAFTSSAALTETPTGGLVQLYVRDRVTGRTVLASGRAGSAADAPVVDDVDARSYAISGDGRFVVFASQAANLVPTDVDGAEMDVFRKDLLTGAVGLVSWAADGGSANAPVGGDPDISFDGSVVTYETGAATNLWTGDPGPGNDIVARDLLTGSTRLVSASVGGSPLTGVIQRPSISADGRRVAFEDDGQIIVRDRVAEVSLTGPAGEFADLSGDGRALAFRGPSGDILLADPVQAAAVVVAADGTDPTVSADGLRVGFTTTTALVVGDTNGQADVYLRRVAAGPERVSQRGDGSGVNRPSDRAALSAHGGSVAFTFDDAGAGATLNPDDLDGAPDVLIAESAPTDVRGPEFGGLSPADGAVLDGASVAVTGRVTDVSGVVGVTVDGFPALIDASGGFALQAPVVSGLTRLTVRATDAAGNASERQIAVTRAEPQPPVLSPVSRTRSLRVTRGVHVTRVRFVLDAGATRVTVRLWKRVLRSGAPTTWTSVGPLRAVALTPGTRSVGLSAKPLPSGVYQVRVITASPGGTALSVLRFTVPRRT